jgi:quercetin dioxygenase-like cupin family protein
MSHQRNQQVPLKLKATAQTCFSGITADILLGGEAPMTVMNMAVEPNLGAPAHISFEEDKVFVVTQGRFEFLLGDARIWVEAGDRVFVPKGAIHSFRADRGTAYMTLVSTPARHDRFFHAINALPEPRTPEDVAAVCTQFAQQMRGPIVGTE